MIQLNAAFHAYSVVEDNSIQKSSLLVYKVTNVGCIESAISSNYRYERTGFKNLFECHNEI